MSEELAIRGLWAGYGREPVLKGFSLTVGIGLTAILGQNGCGKTTFFRTVSGVLKPDRGELFYNGKNLAQMTVRQRAEIISCMNQRVPRSTGLRVIDEAEMAFYPSRGMFFRIGNTEQEMIEKTAEILDISGLLYENTKQLSAGQAQLTHLLTAMVQNTPVLLADEPTSALDYNNVRRVMEIFRKLGKEKTVLVVLHDPALALNFCQRVCVMNEGRIAAEIVPEEETAAEIEEKLNTVYPGIRVIYDNNEYFCR